MESSPAIDSASSTVTKPMNGEELAHQLLSTLSVDFSIPPSSLLAAARDRAFVNNVAIRHLKILYPNLVDIGCSSHTPDHVHHQHHHVITN